MRSVIRWFGYALIALGAAIFAGRYFMTYQRGGIGAVAERFFHPLSDAVLLGLCVAPGLIILGFADRSNYAAAIFQTRPLGIKTGQGNRPFTHRDLGLFGNHRTSR
ncbi:hypothetical protein [Bradyrhizobium sp. JYMT SZCCT0428]|uniref:hypothetical protein n=1 Tax=Bradyrhizobium sp. JYMT SZCCT0428 TaxID=2807673 RepID=UPI001BA5A5F4|nr:hypothetical protein [Bradyrhizobium sp. JYMT SZCCT0428]MBR1156106.1 hypothetical protein [Bradyrhizobium sp. JYMT SZCCT0428]